MDKDNRDVVFQLGGIRAAINIQVAFFDPHLQKNGDTASPCNVFAAITGRRDNGEVIKAAGISITHPTDLFDAETGIKLAVQDAALNLYGRDGLAAFYMKPETYVKIWWSAYQRARHNQPPYPFVDPGCLMIFS